ncbi:MAG: hypothetical protein MJZ20_06940 [Bacteroidaceae bacterium]|nr:hypothetical protein [Bacteroidaceae bacterium]
MWKINETIRLAVHKDAIPFFDSEDRNASNYLFDEEIDELMKEGGEAAVEKRMFEIAERQWEDVLKVAETIKLDKYNVFMTHKSGIVNNITSEVKYITMADVIRQPIYGGFGANICLSLRYTINIVENGDGICISKQYTIGGKETFMTLTFIGPKDEKQGDLFVELYNAM